MDEQALLDRIDRWQAAGLIDAATGDRLRAAEAARPAGLAPAPSPTPAIAAPPPASSIGSTATATAVFGPSVSVVEMFAYLGTAFLLAAVAAFFARISSGSDHAEAILGAGAGVEAIALAAIGLVLRGGTPRRRRAAGIAFLAAVVAVGAAVNLLAGTIVLDGLVVAILSTGLALAVAVALRLVLPAVTTELAVLGTITALSSSLLVWIEAVVAPPPTFDNGLVTPPAVDPADPRARSGHLVARDRVPARHHGVAGGAPRTDGSGGPTPRRRGAPVDRADGRARRVLCHHPGHRDR